MGLGLSCVWGSQLLVYGAACERKNMGKVNLERKENHLQWDLPSLKEPERRTWSLCSRGEKHKAEQPHGVVPAVLQK